MKPSMPTFDSFLNPLSQETFFNDYFEKKPLITNNLPSLANAVLSLGDIESLIGSAMLSPAEFRMAKDGGMVPANQYIDKDSKRKNNNEFVNFSKALGLYASGATMVFESLHERLHALGDFCQHLEGIFINNVQSNIYLTPPGSKGFARHFDTHEVFVLQIEGEKHWLIYDQPPIKLPVNTQSHHRFKHTEYPILHEFNLSPGQCVYIPRGYMHEARANVKQSLHVTFGISTYKWVDFLNDLVQAGQYEIDALRKSVPLHLLRSRDESTPLPTHQQLKHLSEQIFDNKTIDQMLNRRNEFFLSSRTPRIKKGLASLDRLSALTTDTVLSVRQPLSYIIEKVDDKVVLKVDNKSISFPAMLERYLTRILEGGKVSIADLDDQLSGQSKRVLIERLIKESVLEF